jgi:two-component system, NtrC family, sensor kinase
MSIFADSLANVLTITALVAIFLTLRRTNLTPRFKLWMLGWKVMWLHFALSLVPESMGPRIAALVSSVQIAALGIAGLLFLVSVTIVVDETKWRRMLLLSVSPLICIYSLALGFDYTPRLILTAVAAVIYGISLAVFLARYRKATLYVIAMASVMISFGGLGVYRVYAGDFMGGFYSMLLAQYAMCAILTLRAFKAWTAGVVVTFIGFVAWSAVWGVGAFAPQLVQQIGPSNDLFNFPKLLVAFGMIMTELERRSQEATDAQHRERQLGKQLSSFATVTTRLLEGAEVNAICNEIAGTITETGNFRRAAIVLTDDAGRMFVAGHSGLLPKDVNELGDAISRTTVSDIENTVAYSRQLGNNSVVTPREVMDKLPCVPSKQEFAPSPYWKSGDEVMVPLRSSAGNYLGAISLDDPKDTSRVVAEEMYAIEMLATQLAAAIEKASLQRKMVVREKLASIGQLVGGVAHELNNPLTVILGYSDLLAESDTEHRFDRELTTMRREARRMRSIIDNLLRFARQSKTETQSANLPQAIEEALALRNYEFTRRGIEVTCDLSDDLPSVNIDESQLKTVIVNLMNNAFDAVQDSAEKKVSLYTRRVADKVLLSVIDTGTGFTDVTRAFDPFFSTKGVGRGSGLGLSICYGIVKQHGGDIYAQNVHPAGACVTLELRLTSPNPDEAEKTARISV